MATNPDGVSRTLNPNAMMPDGIVPNLTLSSVETGIIYERARVLRPALISLISMYRGVLSRVMGC